MRQAERGLTFEQRHGAETAVGTDADDGAAARRQRRKLLDRLTENPRAGGGEWMAERDAAAVRVHPLARKAAEIRLDPGLGADELLILEPLDVTEHLRRKGLMNFP